MRLQNHGGTQILFQDINFWGSVYASYYALPHLKKTGGRILVNASASAWNPMPRMSFYNVYAYNSVEFCFKMFDFEVFFAGKQSSSDELLRDDKS